MGKKGSEPIKESAGRLPGTDTAPLRSSHLRTFGRRPGRHGSAVTKLLVAAGVVAGLVFGAAYYFSSSTIYELLTENRSLSQAIHNLTTEQQIGYAKLVSQETDPVSGTVRSTLKFVQTLPSDPAVVAAAQEFVIEGDVAHFDALIVKFGDDYVKDGRERALFLWRRVYGENTSPAMGSEITPAGDAPERYEGITRSLRMNDRGIFWEAVWDLANDPERLSGYGVKAVFGNTVYFRLKSGYVYLFKLGPTGQIYPEVVREW